MNAKNNKTICDRVSVLFKGISPMNPDADSYYHLPDIRIPNLQEFNTSDIGNLPRHMQELWDIDANDELIRAITIESKKIAEASRCDDGLISNFIYEF